MPVISQRLGGLPKRDYFSMARRVGKPNGPVGTLAHQNIVAHDQSPHRDLTIGPGLPGQFKRLIHPVFVREPGCRGSFSYHLTMVTMKSLTSQSR